MKRVIGDLLMGAIVMALAMKVVKELLVSGPISIGLVAPMLAIVILMGAASVVAVKPDF